MLKVIFTNLSELNFAENLAETEARYSFYKVVLKEAFIIVNNFCPTLFPGSLVFPPLRKKRKPGNEFECHE